MARKSWDRNKKEGKRKIAVLCSDLHLSHRCPPFRERQNWYETMVRYLTQLFELSRTDEYYGEGLPIICAGDIFDRWNEPPELINMCLESMPTMYAIPGQHDLPYHAYEDITKTAYWTLVKAGKIINLSSPLVNEPIIEIMSQGGTPIHLHPFPYGFDIKKPIKPSLGINLAVVHSYLWVKGHGYPDAPVSKRLKKVAKVLKHYDAAVFGDNHKGFLSTIKDDQGMDISILNCGSFIRRKSDEETYQPAIGYLFDDGSIERKFLDTSKDVLGLSNNKVKQPASGKDYQEVIDELNRLGDAAMDFADAVRRKMEREVTRLEVRKEVETAIEESA